MLLVAGSHTYGAAPPDGLPGISAEQVSILRSLHQQFVDLDAWKNTQFKSSARARAARWLADALAGAEKHKYGFNGAVAELRSGRFRTCVPEDMRRALREQIERLKTKPEAVTKDDPLRIPEDLAETLLVLDAAYVGLCEESEHWTAANRSLQAIEASVVNALILYQEAQRRESKVRMLLAQPAWVQALIGGGFKERLEEARAAIARMDRGLTAADITRLDPSNTPREILASAGLEELRTRQAMFASVSQGITDWFASSGDSLVAIEQQWRRALDQRFFDIPSKFAERNRYAIRCVPTPASGSGNRLEAKLFLVRPRKAEAFSVSVDPAALKALSPPTPPQPGIEPAPTPAAQQVGAMAATESFDLGITLTGVVIEDGTPKLLPAGLGANARVDTAAIAGLLRRFGIPEGLSVDQVRLIELDPRFAHVEISANISIPGLPVSAPIRFRIQPEIWDAGKPPVDFCGDSLGKLPGQLLERLNRDPVKLPIPGGVIELGDWKQLGDWSDGRVAFQAKVNVPGLASWNLPVSLLKRGSSWRLAPEPHPIPSDVVAGLLSRLRRSSLSALDGVVLPENVAGPMKKLGKFSERLGSSVGIEGLKYDADAGRFVGTIRWSAHGLPSLDKLPRLDFSFALADARLEIPELKAAEEALKTLATQLAEELVRELLGELADDLKRALEGKQLGFFGQTLTVLKAEHDAVRQGYRISAEMTVAGRQLRVRNLLLLGLKQPLSPRLEGVRADFSEAVTEPGLEGFVRELLGAELKLEGSLIEVGGLQLCPEGVRAQLALKCAAIGGITPTVEVTLGLDGVGVKPDAKAILGALSARISQQLGGSLTLGDIGPVKDVVLDTEEMAKRLPSFELLLKGSLIIAGIDALKLPFRVKVFPEFDPSKIEITAPSDSELQKLLGEILPVTDVGGVGVKLLGVKRERPFGFYFDASFNVFVFQMKVGKTGITQGGIELPEVVSAQFPGFITVGWFALVNPGVGLHTRDVGRLDVLGDLTFAAQGIDHVLKVKSTMIADPRKLIFGLDGQLVLLDVLPIFGVEGRVDFKNPTLSLKGRSLPPIDSILTIRGETVALGEELLFRQSARMGVLGLELMEINVEFRGKTQQLEANGRARLPLGEATIRLWCPLNFTQMNAEAGLSFRIGGWEISGATVKIAPARAMLQARVIGLKLTVIAPGVAALTPGLILDVLKSMFDFDLGGLWNAITRREIVVNLTDSKGESTEGSLGQGDPLPAGATAPSDVTRPPGGVGGKPAGSVGQPGQPGIPASSHGEPGSDPSGPGAAAGGGGMPTPQPGPRVDRPSEVVTYQPGNARISFVAAPEDPSKLIERTTYENVHWDSHFYIPKHVADGLKSGNEVMILDVYWLRLVGGGSKPCRRNFKHPILPFYIVLRKDGSIVAAGMFPDGGFTPLNIPELKQIGELIDPPNWWEKITSGQRGKLFSPGDIEMIRELVRARLNPQERDIKEFLRLQEGGSDRTDDGYLFRRVDDEGRPCLAIQSRKGFRVDIPAGSPLYAPLESRTPASAELVKLLIRAASGNEQLGLLAVEGNATLLLQRREQDGRCWLVSLGPSGRRDLLFTSPLRDPMGIERPRWPRQPAGSAGPLFAQAVAAAASSGEWDEVRFNAADAPAGRAAFAWHIAEANWAASLILESGNGPGSRVRTVAKVPGATVVARYKEWADQGNLRPEARKTLESADDRRWLLDILLAEREEWPKYFRSNPLGLLAP